MLQLLRLVSLRHLFGSPLRTALTILGVALGVATMIGIASINRTVLDAFRSTVDTISGKADLTQNGRKALTVVSKLLLKDYKNDEYWIEGHTDSDPVQKSKFGSNRDLSVARAMAVLRFLVEGFDHPTPRLALAVVDLAEIQHRPLNHLATGAPLALHDAPIAMLLAVLDPSVRAQEHD